MGLKSILDGLKQKAENYLKEETDPAKIRAAKKAANEKKMKRTAAGIKLAQKGIQVANTVNEKVEQVTEAAAETTAKIVDKAAPIAEKVDQVAGGAIDTAVGAFNVVKDKVIEGGLTAAEKYDELKKDGEKKPSTGSSLLDLLAPAVPDTDATKPKKPDAPKAPKP